MSKWVDAKICVNNDIKTVYKFFKKLFALFGMPRIIISDGGIHFCNNNMEILLNSHGLNIG